MGAHRLIVGLTSLNVLLGAALLLQGHRVSAVGEPGTVRATAIELVDERGRIRAQLNVESNGEAVLRLRDSRGEIRVKLGADSDGSGLLLLDGSTEPGIHMLANRRGARLTLASKDRPPRVITP